MLKYKGYQIVFQEIPDEISLAINITGCPRKCNGCHSKYLWDDSGIPLKDDIFHLLEENIDKISCVCFMGGDHELSELMSIIIDIRKKYPDIKIALYTGDDDPPTILITALDYIKIGHYDEKFGGLSNHNTNQRLLKKNDAGYEDITYKMQPRADL